MNITTESVDKIAPELIKVLPRMQATKDGKNPHFRSDYMTLDGIINTVKPILAEVDIGVIQSITTADRDVTCTTVLLHTSGQSIVGTATVHADKDTPQGFGSAITYARRYGIAALLGIADCEDDDGNAAEAASKKKVSTPKPKPKVEPKPNVSSKKLDESQVQQILDAFSKNMSIDESMLEKHYGPTSSWTDTDRKVLLKKYNSLVNKTLSIENFLDGK